MIFSSGTLACKECTKERKVARGKVERCGRNDRGNYLSGIIILLKRERERVAGEEEVERLRRVAD